MQIVIEIPDTAYEGIKKAATAGGDWGKDLLGVLCKGVNNGHPLPKGYGRLGDLDALESEMINGIKAGNYEEGYENYSHILNVDDCVECVRYAETIIEADKEGEKE